MSGIFDDPDPLMLDQEDYEAAEFSESLDTGNASHFDWDSVIREQDDFEAAENAEKYSGGGSRGSGGCGSCILYAFGGLLFVMVLGFLVSACN